MWGKYTLIASLTAATLLPTATWAETTAPPFSVAFHDLYAPTQDFQAFLQTLRTAVETRDAASVYASVADDYYYARDFGGMFNPKLSAVENFKNTFPFDNSKLSPEYQDHGWMAFDQHLAASKFQRIEGAVCGEAEAEPAGKVTHDDYWFEWAYINGVNVRVREQPSLQAPVVTQLSLITVKALQTAPGEHVGLTERKYLAIEDRYVTAPDTYWVKIDTLTGKQGYVHSSFISGFLQPKLCFKQVEGKWKIAGYRGGGD